MRAQHLYRVLLSTSVIALAVFAQQAQAASDSGTLKIGTATLGECESFPQIFSGFVKSLSAGSYTPTALTGGATVIAVADDEDWSCGGNDAEFQASGFSADPGSSWLTSVTCNGVTRTASSMSTYFYSGGVAMWRWSSPFGFISLSIGSMVSCTVDHS